MTQVKNQPIELLLFSHIKFDKTTITFLVAEIASWLVISLQFEIASVDD